MIKTKFLKGRKNTHPLGRKTISHFGPVQEEIDKAPSTNYSVHDEGDIGVELQVSMKVNRIDDYPFLQWIDDLLSMPQEKIPSRKKETSTTYE